MPHEHTKAHNSSNHGNAHTHEKDEDQDDSKQLEDGLIALLHKLGALGHAVHDFSSQQVVNDYLNETIALMAEVDKAKDAVPHLIPMSVLRAVDEGKNPDDVTKQELETVVMRNQVVNAKISALDHLKETIEKEVKRVVPGEYEIYDQVMKPPE